MLPLTDHKRGGHGSVGSAGELKDVTNTVTVACIYFLKAINHCINSICIELYKPLEFYRRVLSIDISLGTFLSQLEIFAYVCCHILSVFCHYANMLFLDQHLQRVCALTEIVHHPPPFAFPGSSRPERDHWSSWRQRRKSEISMIKA